MEYTEYIYSVQISYLICTVPHTCTSDADSQRLDVIHTGTTRVGDRCMHSKCVTTTHSAISDTIEYHFIFDTMSNIYLSIYGVLKMLQPIATGNGPD